MKLFDTHAHITSEYFDLAERKNIFSEAQKNGVDKILIPGTTKKDCLEIMKYVNKQVHIAIGIHPSEAHSIKTIDFMYDIDYSKVSAIGEIGLDTYHDTNPNIEIQKKVFKKQLDIALDKKLPVIIHNRETSKEILEIISQKKYANLTYIMHSFAQDKKIVKEFLKLNVYISFSGIITFKNANSLREALDAVPIEKILIETDSPYLTPEPHRGKTNYPKYVKHILKFIANQKNIDMQEAANIIYKNSINLFKF